MKRLLIIIAALLLALPAVVGAEIGRAEESSQRPTTKERKQSAVIQEIQNHFKFHGFIRTYFAYDTRESVAGRADLVYYLPKDHNYNEYGDDLNAVGSFRYLSLSTCLGVDVSGYKAGRTEFGAKVDADFYSGLTGSTGTATFRLRQAYATFMWDNLRLGLSSGQTASVKLTVGQTWHPIAIDHPHVLSLGMSQPFNACSCNPQVLMDATLGKHFIISVSALWQMQDVSTGPSGRSADYMKYSGIPEGYVGLTYMTGGFRSRIGLSVLSIKPRNTATDENGISVRVSDRMTGFTPFIFLQYSKKNFEIKAKTIYSQAGDHLYLLSGYGISAMCADGHYDYTPLQVSSTWASFSYGSKWQVMLMGGYIKCLGSTDKLLDPSSVYYMSSGYQNIVSMWRMVPTVAYNAGKFTIALEYNMTSARYGNTDSYNDYGVATGGIHPVTNHRIQMMVRFNF